MNITKKRTLDPRDRSFFRLDQSWRILEAHETGLQGEKLEAGSFLVRLTGAPGGIRTHNRLIRRNGIPPIIVAGMLGHSLAIYIPAYAHLARLARFARYELLAMLPAVAIFQGLRMKQLA